MLVVTGFILRATYDGHLSRMQGRGKEGERKTEINVSIEGRKISSLLWTEGYKLCNIPL